MSVISQIIFDCDGVILDSVNIKTNTFAILFEQYGEDVVTAVVKYHLNNGGLSRYEKFRYYFKELLNQELTNSVTEELDHKFNDLSFQSIIKAPFIPGAFEFISQNYKRWSFYVASGTPEKELKQIFNKRGLTKYFKGIFGSPAHKNNLVENIVKETQVSPEHILMIGDSSSDQEAADFTGISFLGIGGNWANYDSMPDLQGLKVYLETFVNRQKSEI